MTKLTLENIRTFSGRHQISVRPLTIVSGENSSGKSTFLGMFSAVCDQAYPIQPNFNSPPYNFGNYDTIATYRRGRAGRSRSFSLGYSRDEPAQGELKGHRGATRLTNVEARYVGRRGQIRLERFDASAKDFEFSLAMDEQVGRTIHGRCSVRVGDKTASVDIPDRRLSVDLEIGPLIQIVLGLSAIQANPEEPEAQNRSRLFMEAFDWLLSVPLTRAQSIAPIRTKPERTYSQIREAFKPTGDHVPYLLDDVLSEDSSGRRNLETALAVFGQESRLFKKVDIKHLGKKATDPFELMVTLSGTAVNLVDVGYGVSQSLPVLVQTALKNAQETLLLQQPEVHLHPRAQAALGSFFCRIASSGSGNLIVETHSDYIIDRIRQEVAAGRISADRVMVLYFHLESGRTVPHELSIDSEGNLLNVPPYYREFFLKEELNLLNWKDRY